MTAQAEIPTSVPSVPRTTRPAVRAASMAVWAGAVAAWWAHFGIPNDSITVLLTGWLGTIAWNIESPWRQHLRFLRDWALPAVLLIAYFFSRAAVDEWGIPVHYTMPVDFDRWIGGGVTPTERLQDAWCGNPCSAATEPRFYDVYFTSVYATHFLFGLSLAVVLWIRSHDEWLVWMRRFIGLNLAGLVIYVSYPMAPPWLASQDGYLGPVARLTSRGWRDIGLQRVDVILNGMGNPVAAMPSLHAGTAVLIAAYGIWRLRSPLRWLLVLYPISMCVGLVYYGEHYVVDLAAGAALAGLVMLVCGAWERARARRTEAAETAEVVATAEDVRT